MQQLTEELKGGLIIEAVKNISLESVADPPNNIKVPPTSNRCRPGRKRSDLSSGKIKAATLYTANRIDAIEKASNSLLLLSAEETGLHLADADGRIADTSWLACKEAMINKEIEKYIEKVHPHNIWKATDKNLWTTYLRKEDGKLKKVSSKTREGLMEKLYKVYGEGPSTRLIDLWPKVLEWKSRSIKGKSLKIYDGHWKKYYLNDPIAKMPIQKIDLKTWIKFFDRVIYKFSLSKNQYSDMRTVANYLEKYAIREDIVDRNPINDLYGLDFDFRKTGAYNAIKAPHFSEGSEEKIREWCESELKNPKKPPIYPLTMMFNIPYGLRIGELSGICWSDIDLKNEEFCVSHQYVTQYEYSSKDGEIHYTGKADTAEVKGHEAPRVLPITKESMEALMRIKALNLPGERVFQVRYNTYNNKIKNAAEATGQSPEAFRTHSVRTTAARKLYRNSKDIKLVQSLLGHTTSAMTEKYIKNFKSTESLRNYL